MDFLCVQTGSYASIYVSCTSSLVLSFWFDCLVPFWFVCFGFVLFYYYYYFLDVSPLFSKQRQKGFDLDERRGGDEVGGVKQEKP